VSTTPVDGAPAAAPPLLPEAEPTQAEAAQAPPVERAPAPAGPGAGGEKRPGTVTVRLPFLTVSVTRPGGGPGPAGAKHPAGGHHGLPGGSVGAERLLFYGGVAALGIAGVIEWPVAAAIAVGTHLAGKARTGPPRRPAAG
jgi:hypothetical protein